MKKSRGAGNPKKPFPVKPVAIIIAVLVLSAAVLFCYHPVAVRITGLRHEKAVEDYIAAVNRLEDGEIAEIAGRAARYNAEYAQKHPFIFGALSGEDYKDYETELGVPGTDAIGYIEIPAISVRLPIYRYSSDSSMKKGCGHLETSSLPVGGETVHSYLLSHRNMANAVTFEHLDRLKNGDTFSVTALKTTVTYTVNDIRVVDPDNRDEYADQTVEEGAEYCTLVTCHPNGGTEYRLLVTGKRI